jgi:ribosomal protein S18 acetylase RimI-like enzyme
VELVCATEAFYPEIVSLVSSAEELFLVYPSGQFPLDVRQLEKLAEKRQNLTVGLLQEKVMAFANLYDIRRGESAFIGNIIVSDKFKGKGYGKELTRHMIAICETQYSAKAHLSVFSYNTRAILMYAGLGFQPYAIEKRKNLSGEPVALIHMRHKQ